MKTIIVVGGGFAGRYAAKKLEKKFQVILIDNKDYFEFTPSILRTLVEPEHLKKIQIPHQAYLKKAQIVVDQVKEVTKNQVITAKQKFSYDYLIIASGSFYHKPLKEANVLRADRGEHLVNQANQVLAASKVLIVGGGLVGVELAGEIIEKYPNKEVIIIQSRNCCLPRASKKIITYAENFLKKKGVQLVFGEKVIKEESGVFITNKNSKIKADIGFFCIGISPNSQFLKNTFPNYLDPRGFVRVNSNLLLEGLKNIFAPGDVNNIREEKTAQNAEIQARVVVKNILNLKKGKELIEYKSKPRVMSVSLGKKDGLMTYKNFSWTGRIPAWIKSFIEFKEMRKSFLF